MLPALLSSLLVASALPATTNAFDLVRDYSGTNFFQGWDFYGSWDNLTLGACSSPPRLLTYNLPDDIWTGDVWWLNQTEATAEHLAYVNDAGHAIIRVDNTTNVLPNDKRNTVSAFLVNYLLVTHNKSGPHYDFRSLRLGKFIHHRRPTHPLRLLRMARILDKRHNMARRRRNRHHREYQPQP